MRYNSAQEEGHPSRCPMGATPGSGSKAHRKQLLLFSGELPFSSVSRVQWKCGEETFPSPPQASTLNETLGWYKLLSSWDYSEKIQKLKEEAMLSANKAGRYLHY